MVELNLPLKEMLSRLGREVPGSLMTWIDEFIGGDYEEGYENTSIFVGRIESNRLRYDHAHSYDSAEPPPYHRSFRDFDDREQLVSMTVKRTLIGTRIVIHSRLYG